MGNKKQSSTRADKVAGGTNEKEKNYYPRAVSFSVDGEPRPWPKKMIRIGYKGTSPYPVVRQNDPKKKFAQWEERVLNALAANMRKYGDVYYEKDVPLGIGCTFAFKRPKTVGKERHWPIVKPDMDNLEYAIANILKGRLYHDDSQLVVRLPGMMIYSDEYGDGEGACISISPISKRKVEMGEEISQCVKNMLLPKEIMRPNGMYEPDEPLH